MIYNTELSLLAHSCPITNDETINKSRIPGNRKILKCQMGMMSA